MTRHGVADRGCSGVQLRKGPTYLKESAEGTADRARRRGAGHQTAVPFDNAFKAQNTAAAEPTNAVPLHQV